MLNIPFDIAEHPHKRYNILTGDWILVSPHRVKRPWQGKVEELPPATRPSYDSNCYLCPGNKRADGTINPDYKDALSFVNDFSALLEDTPTGSYDEEGLLSVKNETGICKVICFSPQHNLTLPQMTVKAIQKIIELWRKECNELSKNPSIKYIQIFENKGDIMGCSNPHPHGQIWASSSIPQELCKETKQQQLYFEKHGRSLLGDYLKIELKKK